MGAFSISAKAQSSFTVDLYQDGSDVVATGSGNIDLDGLSNSGNSIAGFTGIVPSEGLITTGTVDAEVTEYDGVTGSASFGSGSVTGATSSSGDSVTINNGSYFLLPVGYTSGAPLSDTATYADTTLATLGVTPGTYTWTWGTESENTFTLNAVAVPEPSQYGLGVLLATLGFVAWRRFSARAARA
jgi:hypothetical protein